MKRAVLAIAGILALLFLTTHAFTEASATAYIPVRAAGADCVARLFDSKGKLLDALVLSQDEPDAFQISNLSAGQHQFYVLLAPGDDPKIVYDSTMYLVVVDVFQQNDRLFPVVFAYHIGEGGSIGEEKVAEIRFENGPLPEQGRLIIQKEFVFITPAPTPEPTPAPTETPMPTEEPTPTPAPFEMMDILVTKTWKDQANKDGNRPETVHVQLWQNGTPIRSAALSQANGWRYLFSELPKEDENGVFTYTVTEEPILWYTAQIDGFHITNVYEPEVTELTVRKVWEDNGNRLQMRPKSVLMTLNSGESVVLSEANGWTATLKDLATRRNGEPFTYVWHEQEVLGYQEAAVAIDGATTTFTNRIRLRGEPQESTEKENDPKTSYTILEDYETPLGVEVMINHVGDCFD